MATFIEILFLVQMLILLGIVFAKIFNLLQLGKWYSIQTAWLLLIIYFIFWLIGLIATFFVEYATTPDLIFIQLFKIESFFMILNVLFIVAELFFSMNLNTEASKTVTSLNWRF